MYASEVRLCLEIWVGLKSEVALISLMTSPLPNFAEKKEKKMGVKKDPTLQPWPISNPVLIAIYWAPFQTHCLL